MEKEIPPSQIVKRSTSKQISLSLMANFSTIAPAMSLGFSAVVLPVLKQEDIAYRMTEEQTSWFVSAASLATPFGSLCSGPICDRLGRRSALFCVNIISLFGWITIAIAYYLPQHQYPILLVGRTLTGLSTGLSSMPATVYMAEVSSPTLRSVFTSWNSLFFSFGILVVYSLGYFFKDSWGFIALIGAMLPIIGMLFVIFWIPESPSWLITNNRYEEAKNNLIRIFAVKDCENDVQTVINALIDNEEKTRITASSSQSLGSQIIVKLKYLIQPNCLKPLKIILMFFFFQQFSGIFAVVFYAVNIVEKAGVELDPYLTIVLIGATRFVVAICASVISRKVGRRPLATISTVGTSISMLCLGTYVLFYSKGKISEDMSFIPIVLLMCYFILSTLGLLMLPFAMAAEVFPLRIRGTASGLCSCIAYIFSFLSVKFYTNMETGLNGYGVFYFYGSVAFVGIFFVIFYLPETRGKTLQEIEEHFLSSSNRRVLENEIS